MAAVQPFISGAISKTVNMPEDVTVEDVEQLHIDAWKLGIKAVAIYRDNCKVAQPLSTTKKDGAGPAATRAPAGSEAEAHARELTAKIAELEAALVHEQSRTQETLLVGAVASACPVGATSYDLLLPGRRLRGLRHRRRVRGRPPRRGVHEGVEAGVDPGRHHGRLLHLGQPRPPARCAAVDLRPQVRQHALRAGRDHRRPGPADRLEPRRLHLPPAGPRLPALDERVELGILSTGERMQPTLPGVEETASSVDGADGANRNASARAATAWPHGTRPAPRTATPVLLLLRQRHAAGRFLLRLPELRGDERLLVADRRARLRSNATRSLGAATPRWTARWARPGVPASGRRRRRRWRLLESWRWWHRAQRLFPGPGEP